MSAILFAHPGSCSWTPPQQLEVLTEWNDGSPPLHMDIRSRLAASRNSPTCRKVAILRTEGQLDAESTPEQRERLERALPLVWVHVPKSGTSFANALLHHVGICPKWPSCAMLLPGEKDADFFKDWDQGELCSDGFAEDTLGHRSAGPSLLLHGPDHGAMFLRQPEQRMMAAHRDGWPEASMSRDVPLATYARGTAGCTVKMLTRRGTSGSEQSQQSYCAFDGDPPSSKEVETAISRLRKFAFVGLAEEWDASICLFHAQFGGRCHDYESAESSAEPSDAPLKSTLQNDSGVPRDKYDGELYAAAEEIFHGRLKEYGVVPGKKCPFCPSPKDLLNQPGCQRERNTDVNDWYPDRRAHETDCAFMCTDPGKATSPLHSCVASDFSTEDNGRCDLYLCGEGAKQQIKKRGPPADIRVVFADAPADAASDSAADAAADSAADAAADSAADAAADVLDPQASDFSRGPEAISAAVPAAVPKAASDATAASPTSDTAVDAGLVHFLSAGAKSQSTAEQKVAAYKVSLERAEADDAAQTNALVAQKVSAYKVALEKEEASDAGNEQAFASAFSRAFAADKV